MNASYDHWIILEHEPIVPTVLRGDRVVTLVDGKGLDIGRVFNTLGFGDYCCLNIIGGAVGDIIEAQCRTERINSEFFRIQANSRINTALVFDQRKEVLMINEPGPVITPEEIAGFFEFFKDNLASSDTLVISGSAPVGFTPDHLVKVVKHAESAGATVKVDIAGVWLDKLIEMPLDVLKLNIEEFSNAFDIEIDDSERIRQFKNSHRIRELIITEGKRGSTAFSESGECFKSILEGVTSNVAAGSGDAFFSGFLYGEAQHMPFEECLHLANACGYANTFHYGAGIFDYQDIVRVYDKITTTRLP